MTFKEEIDLQLRENKTLSYEILSQLIEKTYFSGRDKQIGDTVLYGMLSEDDTNIKLITFHEEEIGVLYKQNERFYNRGDKTSKLPNIITIKNGN